MSVWQIAEGRGMAPPAPPPPPAPPAPLPELEVTAVLALEVALLEEQAAKAGARRRGIVKRGRSAKRYGVIVSG